MDQKECPHEKAEFLGEDTGRNRYFRCASCGAVLVNDGRRTWMIPAVPPDLKKTR